jgi:hypothetical protein
MPLPLPPTNLVYCCVSRLSPDQQARLPCHHLLNNKGAMDCNDAPALAASMRDLNEQLKWEFSINGGSSFDEAISDDAKRTRPLADLCQPIIVTATKAKKKPVIVNSVSPISTHLPLLCLFPSYRFPPNHTSALPPHHQQPAHEGNLLMLKNINQSNVQYSCHHKHGLQCKFNSADL